jgi:hypothetical protein
MRKISNLKPMLLAFVCIFLIGSGISYIQHSKDILDISIGILFIIVGVLDGLLIERLISNQ